MTEANRSIRRIQNLSVDTTKTLDKREKTRVVVDAISIVRKYVIIAQNE